MSCLKDQIQAKVAREGSWRPTGETRPTDDALYHEVCYQLFMGESPTREFVWDTELINQVSE